MANEEMEVVAVYRGQEESRLVPRSLQGLDPTEGNHCECVGTNRTLAHPAAKGLDFLPEQKIVLLFVNNNGSKKKHSIGVLTSCGCKVWVSSCIWCLSASTACKQTRHTKTPIDQPMIANVPANSALNLLPLALPQTQEHLTISQTVNVL